MCDVWRRSQLTRSAYRFGLSFFIRFVDIAIPLVFVFMFRLALYDLFTLPRFARCECKIGAQKSLFITCHKLLAGSQSQQKQSEFIEWRANRLFSYGKPTFTSKPLAAPFNHFRFTLYCIVCASFTFHRAAGFVFGYVSLSFLLPNKIKNFNRNKAIKAV